MLIGKFKLSTADSIPFLSSFLSSACISEVSPDWATKLALLRLSKLTLCKNWSPNTSAENCSAFLLKSRISSKCEYSYCMLMTVGES